MGKKLLFCALAILILGSLFFSSSSKNFFEEPCPFCDPIILQKQKFYEDESTVALCSYKPIVPSHFLVIPKRHVERLEELKPKEILKIHEVIQKVHLASKKVFHTTSYLVHQKNGKEVGQSVPHVHFHVIGRCPNDSSSIKFALQMLVAFVKPPLSQEQMSKTSAKMEEAIQNLL